MQCPDESILRSCVSVIESWPLRFVVVLVGRGGLQRALVLIGVGHRIQGTLRPRGATVQLQNLRVMHFTGSLN